MRINLYPEKRFVCRILGICVLITLFGIVADCEAQRYRGFFKRRALLTNHEIPTAQTPGDPIKNQIQSSPPDRHHKFQRHNPVRDPRYHWQQERFPKYIGGFHSSHFSNIGLPTGDLGFRTNGLYWAPW